MQRRNLVIVRASDKSLHPDWLKGAGQRNWDLVVSYFGDDPERYCESGVMRIDTKGTKWGGLYDLLASYPELTRGYDYIWMPDDDLAATKQAINRLFELCAAFRLDLAQPALKWDSYISHLTTLRVPGFVLRYTNFVEVMAPVFSASMLSRVQVTFNTTRTGWGLDHIWPRFVQDARRGIAIIDDASVRHTRPIGGPLYELLRREGRESPWDELREFYRANGLADDQTIEIYGAAFPGGGETTGGHLYLAARLLLAYTAALSRAPYRGFVLRKLLQFAAQNVRLGSQNVVERLHLLQARTGTEHSQQATSNR